MTTAIKFLKRVVIGRLKISDPSENVTFVTSSSREILNFKIVIRESTIR
jgi:hypothetical protein